MNSYGNNHNELFNILKVNKCLKRTSINYLNKGVSIDDFKGTKDFR